MSMLFVDDELDRKLPEASCPRCQCISNMSTTSNIVWYHHRHSSSLIIQRLVANAYSSPTCGISYRRIIEIDDTSDVDFVMPTQPAPRKKRRLERIKQARRRHVSSDGPRHKYAGMQDETKKQKQTQSSDQSFDQLHHFKRIRLIRLEIPSSIHASNLTSSAVPSPEMNSSETVRVPEQQPRYLPAHTPNFTKKPSTELDVKGTTNDIQEALTVPLSSEPSQAANLIKDGVDAGSAGQSSLHSSVLDYQYDSGRRYHAYKAGWYLLPNDETQQVIDDLFHAVILEITSNNLFHAPLINPRKVLDVGCGTGVWSIDSK